MVAKQTILVSDLSGKQIEDPMSAVKITVTFADARRGQYVIDAHPGDSEVQRLVAKGTRQAKRGRKPKAATS